MMKYGMLSLAVAALGLTLAADTYYLDQLSLETMSCGMRLSPKANRSVTGGPLRLGGATNVFARGVGTHVESVFVLEATGEVSAFDATVGIDYAANEVAESWDTGKNWGGASFRVYADGRLVAETPVIKPQDPPRELHAELKGATTIVLEATDCGDWAGYRFGHADWANARFTLAKGAKVRPHSDAALSRQLGILTPSVSDMPRINGPRRIGVVRGRNFRYALPVSGRVPRMCDVMNLPQGLVMDGLGIITGRLDRAGVYPVRFAVANPAGRTERVLDFVVGDTSLLTPPMGWNSWNYCNTALTERVVEDVINGLYLSGLYDHGYNLICLDDGWARKPAMKGGDRDYDEKRAGPVRNKEGRLIPNGYFPRGMKYIGGRLRSLGYRFGIYSSPGETTCGGYAGSYGYEALDADTFAEWGVDYLKYDWCSYGMKFVEATRGREETVEDRAAPYRKMVAELARQRDEMVCACCQYGEGGVEKWARSTGVGLWRSHGDLKDAWGSLIKVIDECAELDRSEVGPGCWCDPDMMVVGKLDTDKGLHMTDLSHNEQYTHMSIWSILPAPLILGCEVRQGMDEFTRRLLINDEVLAVNQDALGQPARRVLHDDETDVWTRPLEDGAFAVAVMNRRPFTRAITLDFAAAGLPQRGWIRDLWRQRSEGLQTDAFDLELEGHATALFRFVPDAPGASGEAERAIVAMPSHYKFVIFGEDTPLPRGVRPSEVYRFCGAKISQYCERVKRGDYDGFLADVILVAIGEKNLDGDIETTAANCRKLGMALNEYRPEAQVAFVTTLEGLKAPLKKVAAARGGWRWFYCADSEELAKTVETVVERNVPAARRALIPVGRVDEPWWMMRHGKLVRPPERRPDVVFIGDSITHYWEASGSNVWKRWFSGENGAPYRAINLGFGGDRTEHVLWRIDHGELDSLAPRAVVLMIGGNNICHFLKSETPLDTVLGVKAVLDRIRSHVPHAKVILHPIFPFAAKPDDPRRVHNDIVNAELRRMADGEHVIWCDFNDQLLEPDGSYAPAMAADGVHPTEAGYVVWARSLVPTLRRVLAPERPVTLRPQTIIDSFWVAPRMNWIVKDRVRRSAYDVAFVGDSLTECWLWDGRKVWDTRFKGLRKVNLGMSGDTVQGVNWRMANGELDTFKTKVIVYCIGGNNVSSTPEEIVAGVKETLRIFKAKQPDAKVLMVGMFPMEPVDSVCTREKYPEINRRLRRICDGERVKFVDGWSIIPVVDGRLPDLKDGQHFKESGYVAYADLLEPLVFAAVSEFDAKAKAAKAAAK